MEWIVVWEDQDGYSRKKLCPSQSEAMKLAEELTNWEGEIFVARVSNRAVRGLSWKAL